MKIGRPSILRGPIVSACASSPDGATLGDIFAIVGGNYKSIKATVSRLAKTGELAYTGKMKSRRYCLPEHMRRATLTAAKSTKLNPDQRRPMKGSGPALQAGEGDRSRAKVTIYKSPPPRYSPEPGFVGVFGLAGIGRDAVTGNAWSAKHES